MIRYDKTRQAVAARQIEEAMKLRGLGKKQFAELMHRNPSEVTKWLSGKHNFTISLLQEISRALNVQITGVEDVAQLVDGFLLSQEQLWVKEIHSKTHQWDPWLWTICLWKRSGKGQWSWG